PGQFQCEPGDVCFPLEWRCDGHPDCEDERDEQGCGAVTSAEPSPDGDRVTSLWSSALPPTGSAEPGAGVQPRCCEWFSACALSSLELLSILIAVGSAAAWGLSRAKSRADTFGLEKASREQLVPDKSQ
ncbi:RSVR protein, partial [Brachypteracias leptosomus]|nr:RSVR protein [Brachypteracias leptosomus]